MLVAINGFCGKMGQVVYKKIMQDKDLSFAGGVDKLSVINSFASNYNNIAVFDNLNKIVKCEGVIDFSHASSLDEVLSYCIKNRLPLVIATTGHSNLQNKQIQFASNFIPICKSGNFSVGVQALLKLTSECTKIMQNADIEIVETHHNKKIDSPSGTAKMLLEEILKVRPNSYATFNRHQNRLKAPNEIGVFSLRGGNVIGEHKCIFFEGDECITITHQAFSREIFADGAVKAIKFLKNKQKGLYSMQDLLSQEFL